MQALLDALDDVHSLTLSSAPDSDHLVLAGFEVLTWKDPDTFASLHNLLTSAVKTTSVWAGLFLLLPYPRTSMLDDHIYPALFTLKECSLSSVSIIPLCMPGGGLDGVACNRLALLEAVHGEGSWAVFAAAGGRLLLLYAAPRRTNADRPATAVGDLKGKKRRYESPPEPSQPRPDEHPPKSSLAQHEPSPRVAKRPRFGAMDHGNVLVPSSSNSEAAGRVGRE